ncbi:MAG: hypothetical protein ACD_54C00160G0001 [uncultured bacterium]|nr:MAG: hypothetical protein ACD_54C00160G0001 [uncultured bacterium]
MAQVGKLICSTADRIMVWWTKNAMIATKCARCDNRRDAGQGVDAPQMTLRIPGKSLTLRVGVLSAQNIACTIKGIVAAMSRLVSDFH